MADASNAAAEELAEAEATSNGVGPSAKRVDRVKQLRQGSKHILTMFDNKVPSNLELDLDKFYRSRTRRRTQFAQQISTSLQTAGIPVEIAAPMDMAKGRGMHVTLSPGEEYENYQKMSAALSNLGNAGASSFAVKPSDAIDEDEDDDRAGGMSPVQSSDGENDSASDDHDRVTPLPDKQPSVTRRQSKQKDQVSGRRPSGIRASVNGPMPRTPRLHSRRSIRGKENLVKPVSKMIDPLGRFRLGWDVTSIAFILFNAIVLPFEASFASNSPDSPFETFLDVYFLTDILVTLNTAVDREGSIRYDRKLAAVSYLKSWFFIDLTAALPYGYMFSASTSSSKLRRSIKLLRLVRLLRLFRISRILRRIQNAIFIRSTLSSLLKYCLMVMLVSHWFSCAFHAIGDADDSDSWITEQRLQDPYANKWDRYVAALYFAVQTLATIGYGDVAGVSADERLFCIFAMITGGGVFAYGITNIVELVSSLTIQETRFRQKMDDVNEYMNARELPLKLRMEIREFYHNTRQSRESKLNAEPQILNDLSSKLRSKIALSINDQFLRKFPFFIGSDPSFLMELALNMRMIHFAPLEDVILEGEIGHEMFFIFRGAVEVRKKDARIGILGENQYFGEMAILNADNRRTATVRTLCFCELRLLSRTRFLEALALFPAMQLKMAQIAKGRAFPVTRSGRIAPAPASAPETPNATAGAAPDASDNVQRLSVSPMKRSKSFVRGLSQLESVQNFNPETYQPVRATTSARIGSTVHRSSISGASTTGPSVSPAMALVISEIAAMLDESARQQDELARQLQSLTERLDKHEQHDKARE